MSDGVMKDLTKDEGSTWLVYTGLMGGLENLKIETNLTHERFSSVMGECPCGGSGTVHGHVVQDQLLNLQKWGQFPDEPVSYYRRTIFPYFVSDSLIERTF